MKFVAIERPVAGASADRVQTLLEAEAHRVWELYRSGILREIYFTDQRTAVLIMEASTEQEASDVLASLPLVREEMIRFEILALNAYTGFERLFHGAGMEQDAQSR